MNAAFPILAMVPPLRSRSRRALLVLWLGVLALAMNALVGIGHVSARGSDGALMLELCTHAGIVRVDARALDAQGSQAPAQADDMHCCDLCGVRGAPMLAELHPRAAPVAAPAVITARAPPPARGALRKPFVLTPIVPRGPPALA